MSYVIIENFNGGMDTRRMAASSAPGTLIELTNAHITRGGEIEKRKAFPNIDGFPSNTVGLAATKSTLVTFGSDSTPLGLPTGVSYQRLQHPGGEDLTRILSWDLYAGKLYVAAEFANGDVYHFYDGTRVETWFDGKARGTFLVTKTGTDTGDQSRVSFTLDKDSEELEVEVFLTNEDDPDNPVSLTSGTVNIASGDSASDFADTLETAINANTGTTGVTASSPLGLGILNLFGEDAYTNLDGLNVWFTVSELNIFKADPDASPRSARCLAEGSCTNILQLSANASGGVPTYSYAWTIVDDGGAASATLDDATAENPTLTVTNPTASSEGVCSIVNVALELEVTDSAGTPQVTTEYFAISSTHCPPGAFEPNLPGDGGTIYNQVN